MGSLCTKFSDLKTQLARARLGVHRVKFFLKMQLKFRKSDNLKNYFKILNSQNSNFGFAFF
jgi:hypothetical protein